MFRYIGVNGRVIHDKETLNRIRSLAIPPAWTDVWICPGEHGHLHAVAEKGLGSGPTMLLTLAAASS